MVDVNPFVRIKYRKFYTMVAKNSFLLPLFKLSLILFMPLNLIVNILGILFCIILILVLWPFSVLYELLDECIFPHFNIPDVFVQYKNYNNLIDKIKKENK